MTSVHYICERCGGLASLVHHKKYLSPGNMSDVENALGWDNLEALCLDCHNEEHFGGGVCAEGLRFDSQGNIIRSGNID